jgi:hypothetical protein
MQILLLLETDAKFSEHDNIWSSENLRYYFVNFDICSSDSKGQKTLFYLTQLSVLHLQAWYRINICNIEKSIFASGTFESPRRSEMLKKFVKELLSHWKRNIFHQKQINSLQMKLFRRFFSKLSYFIYFL